MERRLAAILAADVVGYSRLMGEDEEGTLARLKDCWNEVTNPAVMRHKGRIVKVMGDGLLVEFPSVVSAVHCAVDIQNEMKAHGSEVAEGRRIELRIGVNTGDVIVEGEDIYGDGVNIAARLEALCEPGGIYVSDKVRNELHGKTRFSFEDRGLQSVKNISQPVRVYSIATDRLEAGGRPSSIPFLLPERPSIAVLPFDSISSDAELEFFSDGITEEIITALSRIPDLLVIARNSSFAYKDRAVSVSRVAEELGVRYVLEGSVRAAGKRVRVTAQLIEGATSRHLWAERYDSELSDIFQVQDNITRSIALALQIKLTYGELARLWEGQTADLNAWAKMVEGRKLFNEYTRTNILSARRLFEEALRIDPKYGGALVHLGLTYWWEARYALEVDVEDALSQAEDIIHRLEEIGERESGVHYLRGYVAFIRRQYDSAIEEIEKAVDLAPSDSWVRGVLGQVYIFAGQPKKGVEALSQAMRLCPYYLDWVPYNLALGYAWAGENEDEAIGMATAYIPRCPTDPYGYTNLAIVQGLFGHKEPAVEAIAQLRARFPGFEAKNICRSELYRDPQSLERVLEILAEAGLPQ